MIFVEDSQHSYFNGFSRRAGGICRLFWWQVQMEFQRIFPRDKNFQWGRITTDWVTNQSFRHCFELLSDHEGNSQKLFAIALVIAWLRVCLRNCKYCSTLHISTKLLLFSKPCVGCFLYCLCLFCVMHIPNLDPCVLSPLSFIWYFVFCSHWENTLKERS